MHPCHPARSTNIISTFQRQPSLEPFIIYPALEGYQLPAEIIRDILPPSYLIEEQWKSCLGFLTVGIVPVDLPWCFQQPCLCNHTAIPCPGAAGQKADG